MGKECKACKSQMHIASKIQSGNAIYETWQCNICNEREELCTGLINK